MASALGVEAPGNVLADVVIVMNGVQEIFTTRHRNVDGVTRTQGQHPRQTRSDADRAVAIESNIGSASMLQQFIHGAKLVVRRLESVLSLEKRELLTNAPLIPAE